MLSFQNIPYAAANIWVAVRGTLTYAASALPTADADSAGVIAGVCAQTMRNARDAVDAQSMAAALTSLYANLAPVLTAPLTLDATTLAYVEARITAVSRAVVGANALVTAPVGLSALAQGQPAVPDPLLTEWMLGARYETKPTTFTGAATFQAAVTEAVNAWQVVATALATQGVTVSGAVVDAVNLMLQAATTVAVAASQIVIQPNAVVSVGQIWNQVVATPAILYAAVATAADPTSASYQELSVLKLLIQQAQDQFNVVVANTQTQAPAQVRVATIRQGDTLMKVAARELGDYTRWTELAAVNALQPPYISTADLPGTVAPGAQIFIPVVSTGAATAVVSAPDYANNYLGTDIYYGPMSTAMAPWTGDFMTISGYANLSFSLGRRLQTPISALIYHPDYGSRLPGAVGAVAGTGTANVLAAYAESAIVTDPRVEKVTSLTATPGANYSVAVDAVVLPNGLGNKTAAVNEVLQP